MKLKKTLAGALVLCLAMGAAGAMAEETTNMNTMNGGSNAVKTADMEVKLTIDRTLDTYTITIPSEVVIDPMTEQGTATIKLSNEGMNLVSCQSLHVFIKGAKNTTTDNGTTYYMKNENGTSHPYYIKTSKDPLINTSDDLLKYDRSEKLDQTKTQELTFYLKSLPKAGVYTDTLTFQVLFGG